MLKDFSSVNSVYFFQNIIIIYGTKWKTLIIFFLFFIIMITEWFLNLLTAFVTWSSVTMESLPKPWSVDVFKFGTILIKILLKTSAATRSSVIIFCEAISFDLPGRQFFFFDKRYFVFILSVKNSFIVFQKVLLSGSHSSLY